MPAGTLAVPETLSPISSPGSDAGDDFEMVGGETYWKGCFPVDTLLLNASSDPALRASSCRVRVQHVDEGERADWQARLRTLAARDSDQRWSPVSYNFVALIAEQGRSPEDPSGFITFLVEVDRDDAHQISDVTLHFDLLFVDPGQRGRGLATLACDAIGEWLRGCRVFGRRIPRRGVNVVYSCDVYSRGGAVASLRIESHLQTLWQDRREGVAPRDLGWAIRDLEVDIEV